MSNRHLARTIAMQTLYEWDFHGKAPKTISIMLSRNITEFAPEFEDTAFAQGLVSGVVEHLSDIDTAITTYAPEWPIEQITIVDRNILRIGVFELVYAEAIPSKVAINEAIEVAKAFGGESSGRFVNGVLGAMYRDRTSRGEIKKTDTEEKAKKTETAVAGGGDT
ncbi:transcription antitermination factor NusB [Patescibacteria group bacterium]|nr:transcription antitermination factor NusB [Patescibacteria group bacterium]